MVKRTREEIDSLAAEMADQFVITSYREQSTAELRARSMALIFHCLEGALDDYRKERQANG